MKRFMGMMPSSEVKMSKRFIDDKGLQITVDAGENGWTILYHVDHSSEYKDVVDTVENNFNKALEVLKSHFSVKETNKTNDFMQFLKEDSY